MDEDISNNGGVYIYNGVGEVPEDVTRVRVDSSVTIIPAQAFEDHVELEEVELPEGLVTIENCAFYHCKSLKSINLPSTLEEISEEAFDTCENLEEIILPQGLQRLGQWAFYKCTSLQRINIPPNVQIIEQYAFLSCRGLIEVSVSEGVKEIGEDSFSRCKSLVSVNLPSSIKVIGAMAFEYCEGLQKIRLPDDVHSIKPSAFCSCNLQAFRVPPLVAEFDMGVVGGNMCMVSLELSESVAEVSEANHNTLLPVLRNIALPSECAVDPTIFYECIDLKGAFPNEARGAISDALRHRFDELPIHKLCYYQSYHPAENVMQHLKREMNPWTSKFPGQLNASGTQQDCLGMTPLHILACSTQQNVEMYRLLIEKYPETLIVKDKWGDIPLLYAFWCNVPTDVIQLLVESYKSIYPEHVFDWGGMILTLAKRNVPLANIQALVNTQQNNFRGQHYDMQSVVMDLATHDDSQSSFSRPTSSIETFQYLLHLSISDRLDSLDVTKWRLELENSTNEFPDKASLRREGARTLYAKLELYESLKEAAPVLELALWKAKIDEMGPTNNDSTGLVQCNKRARVENEITYKDQCRISCGADIVVRNVLRYLLPK